MLWINWGCVGETGEQTSMRATGTGAILTRSAVPRSHIFLGVLFSPDSLAVVVVAASHQALAAQTEITEALTEWGAVTWPDDPPDDPTGYYVGEDDDEPEVGSVPPALLGKQWPSPLTREDSEGTAGIDAAVMGGPGWAVDLESSADAEEGEEGPFPATGEAEEGEEGDPKAGSDERRVAQVPTSLPDEAEEEPAPPPWRDGSRPPRGAPQPKGGSRRRANPQNPRGSPHPWAPTPQGLTDVQKAQLGLSSSSSARASDARTLLEEAIRTRCR